MHISVPGLLNFKELVEGTMRFLAARLHASLTYVEIRAVETFEARPNDSTVTGVAQYTFVNDLEISGRQTSRRKSQGRNMRQSRQASTSGLIICFVSGDIDGEEAVGQRMLNPLCWRGDAITAKVVIWSVKVSLAENFSAHGPTHLHRQDTYA